MEAKEVLETLNRGNARFVAGQVTELEHVRSTRRSLSEEQHPIAVIFGCADSRVTPEFVFDQGLGQLFVVRTAGQVLDDAALGSIEYGVDHLHCTLVMVLGHESCGAVTAAVEGGEASGSIEMIVESIQPAVEMTAGQKGDPVNNAVKAQAQLVAEKLRTTEPILAPAVESGAIQIVAARYDLETGRVVLLD